MAWAGATRQTAITMSRFVGGILSAKGRDHRREDAEWVSGKGTLGRFWQCFRIVTHYCHGVTVATQDKRGCSILLNSSLIIFRERSLSEIVATSAIAEVKKVTSANRKASPSSHICQKVCRIDQPIEINAHNLVVFQTGMRSWVNGEQPDIRPSRPHRF